MASFRHTHRHTHRPKSLPPPTVQRRAQMHTRRAQRRVSNACVLTPTPTYKGQNSSRAVYAGNRSNYRRKARTTRFTGRSISNDVPAARPLVGLSAPNAQPSVYVFFLFVIFLLLLFSYLSKKKSNLKFQTQKQRSQTSKDAVHPPVKVHTGLTIRLRGKDGPISMFKSSLGDPLDAVEAPTLGVKEEEPEYDVLVPDDKYFRNIMKTRPPAFEFVMRMFGPYGKPNYGRKRGELGVSALAPSSDKDSSLPPAFMKGLGGEGEERDEEMSAPEMGVGMEQSEMETGPDTEPEVEPEPEPEVREPSVHELEPDIVLEDYYHRSRRRGTRELSPFTIEGARAWSWSQVKEAVWIIKSYPGSHDNESDGEVEGERGRIEEKEGEGEIEGAVKQRGEDEAGVEVKVEEEAETSVNWDGGMEPDPKSKPVDTLRTETEGGVSENTNAFKNT
ncbi:hypothetical protein EW145_g7037 [Phellinidium pouzarii]|uniref:Uncharacterized protein n=1 Tax=Phellinidium pouzarii TaxID=167371 RepID=A0A4S4KQ59_9AGAM|nr:hypothetical protein EW145_g7037 [Phellinidium pouzarii]